MYVSVYIILYPHIFDGNCDNPHMSHCQKADCIPTLGKGRQFIDKDLYTHYKDSNLAMDDHLHPFTSIKTRF